MLAHLKQGQQVAVPLSFQWGKKKKGAFFLKTSIPPNKEQDSFLL